MMEGPSGVVRTEPSTPDGGSPVTDGPLIVQSDKTLLLEVDHDLAQ